MNEWGSSRRQRSSRTLLRSDAEATISFISSNGTLSTYFQKVGLNKMLAADTTKLR
jgi:hypothetical protein